MYQRESSISMGPAGIDGCESQNLLVERKAQLSVFLLFDKAVIMSGIVCLCVHNQPIFQQHRAMSHNILRCSWTESDVTNRLQITQVT